MREGEVYTVFSERFDALGLDYMVTGSVASSSYGEPRFTQDIDVILALPLREVRRFWEAFPLDLFYCPPEQALREEIGRTKGGHFNLVHHETGFRADVYLAPDDEATAWAFAHTRRVEVHPGGFLRLSPPEYVILGKLQFYAEGGGERHLRDIRAMLELLENELDRKLLERWVLQAAVEEVWSAVNAG